MANCKFLLKQESVQNLKKCADALGITKTDILNEFYKPLITIGGIYDINYSGNIIINCAALSRILRAADRCASAAGGDDKR